MHPLRPDPSLSLALSLFTAVGKPPSEQYMACAESMYKNNQNWGVEPGSTWSYLECHLQFAGAMAVAASGLEIDQLFDKYLYQPFNMTSTTWSPLKNPQLAVGITTTADDFENLLFRLLTYKVLPKEILDVMETDTSQPPCNPSGDGWFGHYAMGHWWECLGYGTPKKTYEREPLPKDCMAAAVQAGPGMFGFYPLIDRSGGGGHAGPKRPKYYFQVALQEPEALSGVPEYLRILTKPVVDVILSGGDPATHPRAEFLAQNAGLLQRDLDDIQSELLQCKCAKKPLHFGEPYKALAANLSADDASLSRRDLTRSNGEGLLLRELVEVVEQQLGSCTCQGRQAQRAPAVVEETVA
eukprot:Transcript_18272.p1 GENE.Transcript_18272~~Transcript_18272.p1  ORF type:complete len:354 (-),score=162.70 Transcript_18272:258-1319(-)